MNFGVHLMTAVLLEAALARRPQSSDICGTSHPAPWDSAQTLPSMCASKHLPCTVKPQIGSEILALYPKGGEIHSLARERTTIKGE